MERRRFFIGLFLMIGLIAGSLFTNIVYEDYLSYGGQMDALVLNNKDLYISSASLLPYILFKRGKQYGICFLATYLLQPLVFLYGGILCGSFLLGSILSLQVIQMGMKGLILVFFSFFPHFILYFLTLFLMVRRNLLYTKKEGTILYENDSFLHRHSIVVEIIVLIIGCILESYVNPSIIMAIGRLLS